MGVQLTTVAFSMVILLFLAVFFRKMRRPPRVTLELADGSLVVTMHGWDAVFCCRRRIVLPTEVVDGVYVSRRDLVPAEGFRLPGTGLPGVIRAGSYGTGPDRDFWDVRRADYVLVIQLKRGVAEYRRIVVEVPDLVAESLRLRPALGAAILAPP